MYFHVAAKKKTVIIQKNVDKSIHYYWSYYLRSFSDINSCQVNPSDISLRVLQVLSQTALTLPSYISQFHEAVYIVKR